MKNFAYLSVDSEPEAVKALSPKNLPLAGGTDILNLMKDYVVQPDSLVNLKAIRRMNAVETVGNGFRIGANATISQILENEALMIYFPALEGALFEIGTPQIRNMSTLGGNLCARPRCWYFRQEWFECSKRGGKKCSALEGDNEFLAIFGTDGPCVTVHPSSAAVALLAYDAKLRLFGPKGERQVGIEEFFTMPATDVARENILKPDEILTHVELAVPPGPSATYEVRHKESHDWPLALASVVLTMDSGKIQSARICLGGVAPIPWRAKAAEAALVGSSGMDRKVDEAAAKAVEGAKPLAQNVYKVQIAKTAVKRAILAAAGAKVR